MATNKQLVYNECIKRILAMHILVMTTVLQINNYCKTIKLSALYCQTHRIDFAFSMQEAMMNRYGCIASNASLKSSSYIPLFTKAINSYLHPLPVYVDGGVSWQLLYRLAATYPLSS